MPDNLKTMVAHYTAADEESRLKSAWGQLELERTRLLLKKHLPEPPAQIMDVGGAAGVYALWLSEQGYQVDLVDPVPKHVEQAQEASEAAKCPLRSATIGDARFLKKQDNDIDVVLMLGPLYHLTEHDDRIKALREAYRVLKPGGMVIAAAISRFASALDGLSRNLLEDPVFVRIVERDLTDGQHRNPTNNPEYFTDTFFHLPEELAREVEASGFLVKTCSAIEGPAWLLADMPAWLQDPERKKKMFSILEHMESQPSIIGASSHFMIVARKPPARKVVIESKQFSLCTVSPEDAKSIAEMANDEEISARMSDIFPYPYTLADAITWARIANASEPVTHFSIIVDGKAVGGIGIHLMDDTSRLTGKIGYWIGRPYWGRGIVTEALKLMTEYAFEKFNINRLQATVYEGNTRSSRVLEKSGYELEAQLKKAIYKRGQLYDKLIYSKRKD
jgi:RimJ/RimL family protein N-acetyltransferase/ubiquinone/menaquinone biosynthesis C-methylase UbiE